MGIVNRIVPGNFRRSPLLILGFLILFVSAAVESALYIIAGSISDLVYVGLALVGCAVVLVILNNWRNGLYVFFIWLLFEDFFRKYLGNNMAIYFAKDFLALVVFLSFFLAYRRREVATFRPPFLVPVLICVWFGIIQVFNFASPSLLYGILGMKLFFYYVLFLFVGYSFPNSETQLRRFFFMNLILILVISSLGIAQAILGHTFLNPEIPAEELRELSTNYRVAPISGAILYRPTSVFVSTGRFADFLLVAWLLVFGFSGYLMLRHKRGRGLAFLVFGFTFAALSLCASRGVVLWAMGSALVGSVAFFWGAPWRQDEIIRVLRNVQRGVLGMIFAVAILLATFPEALLSRVAFYQETLLPSSRVSALQERSWTYPLDNFLAAFSFERWLYGYGIGTASLGTQYVTKLLKAKSPVGQVESGFGTIVIEMGIGGLILWLLMTGAILLSAWRVVRKLRGSPWFPLGFMIFWYAGLLLVAMTFVGIQPYQDFVLNAYFWLLLGILFRLPAIPVSAQLGAVPSGESIHQPRVR